MSISGVNPSSAFAEWRSYMQRVSSSTTTSTSQSRGDGDTDDSASIGQQGFAALFQGVQGGSSPPPNGPPALTDEQAAQIGSHIQSKDPALFKQLDINSDGAISAQELQNGHDKIKAARAANIGAAIDQSNPAFFKALDTNGDGTLGVDELKAAKELLSGASAANVGSTAAATDGSATAGSTAGGVHHHHHHRGGGDSSGQNQAVDGSVANPTTQDSLTSLPQDDGSAKYRANAINDIIQQLFASSSGK